MWTQCTICLSSHHTKQAPEQPSILLVPFFLLSIPSPFLPVGWEEKLRSSQWAYCLPSCWFPLPFFASHPLRLSKAPRQLPFLYLLSFSHFLPLDPDSSSGKKEKFWLLCHHHSISFFPRFTAPFSVSVQTDLSQIYIPAFRFSPLILCLLVIFIFHTLKLCLTLEANLLLFSAEKWKVCFSKISPFQSNEEACIFLVFSCTTFYFWSAKWLYIFSDLIYLMSEWLLFDVFNCMLSLTLCTWRLLSLLLCSNRVWTGY